jgi:hypothetical protein
VNCNADATIVSMMAIVASVALRIGIAATLKVIERDSVST